MKQILLMVFVIIPLFVNAQRLHTKVDEFTKAEIRESGWKTLYSLTKTCKVRIREINGQLYLDLKYMDGSVIAIGEGEKVMFLLEDGTVIKFYNPRHEVACLGCGATSYIGSQAYGIYIQMPTFIEDLRPLRYSRIVKMRIYTTEGYIENKITRGNSENIEELVYLFDNEKPKKQKREKSGISDDIYD